MIVTFCTVAHRSQYLEASVNSLLAQSRNPDDLEIRILVDGPSGEFVPQWIRTYARTQTLMHTPRADAPTIFRMTVNLQRGLQLVGEGSSPYGLVCEDDILFAKDWDRRCLSIANTVHAPLLTLCSAHDLSVFDQNQSEALRFRKPSNFYGHQAVLWSKDVAKLSATQLKRRIDQWDGAKNVPWFIDGATRVFCEENAIPIWATNPSLAKHVGETTSWCTMWNMLVTQRFNE